MADEIETSDTTEDVVPEQMDEDPKKAGPGDEPDEVEAADDDGEPAPKAKPEPKKAASPKVYKFKANGREQQVKNAAALEEAAKELGLDPEMLLRGAGMFKAGQENARQAAEERKKVEALKAKLKSDPRGALREALGDEEAFLKVAIEAVAELAEQERLAKEDPQELARRKREAELKAREEALTAKEKEREEQEAASYQEKMAVRLDGEIKSALESGKIPSDPYFVKRLAAHMLDHLDKGGDADDLSAEDFLPLVLEESQREFDAFLGKLSGPEVIERYPELAEKVRKGFTERIPGAKLRVAPKDQPEARARDEKPAKPKFRSTNDVLAAFKAGRI